MAHKIYRQSDCLSMRVDTESIEWASQRAGNPKSMALSNHAPACIDKLAMAPIGSGHDCFLKGCTVYIDWKIGKVVREHAIRYRDLAPVSSGSIMHFFEEFKAAGCFPDHVATEDDIPYKFAYWISFASNYLQLKTIYAQRQHHKRKEWQEFCALLRRLPNSHWITGTGGRCDHG